MQTNPETYQNEPESELPFNLLPFPFPQYCQYFVSNSLIQEEVI